MQSCHASLLALSEETGPVVIVVGPGLAGDVGFSFLLVNVPHFLVTVRHGRSKKFREVLFNKHVGVIVGREFSRQLFRRFFQKGSRSELFAAVSARIHLFRSFFPRQALRHSNLNL